MGSLASKVALMTGVMRTKDKGKIRSQL